VRLITLLIVLILVSALTAGRADAESFPLKREGGVLVLPVQINNSITIDFIIDSGASDVVLPLDVFSTLSRAGTITSKDMLVSQTYELADGSRHEARRFRIRSLKIGELDLQNVVGSVAPTGGSLLLGQSFLSRLPGWSIDNQREVLVVGESGKSERSASKPSHSENQGTKSSAGHAPAEPLWILVGSGAEGGTPDSIYWFVDVHNIKQIQPEVKAAWVKVTYWFNIKYDYKGPLKKRLLLAGYVGDSNIQQAITSAEPIEGGLSLAEFNCSTDLWKPIDYDKWKPIAPASMEADEESLVCAGR
jgi:clan AA aspartic protease (TIGR02281 family)